MKRFFAILAFLILVSIPAFATVSDTVSPVQIYTSGTATEYPITFDYIDDEDVTVTLVNIATGAETAQTLDVNYTISGDTVTYATAPGSSYYVILRRETPYTQEASFTAGEAPPLSTYGSAFDKLTFLTQDLNERLSRAPLVPADSTVTSPTMPDPARYPGQYIRINSGGTNYEAIDLSSSSGTINLAKLSDYASFNTMVSTIGTTEKTVFIDTVGTLTANATIPITLHLIMLKGGAVTLGNYNLTINGPFKADLAKVFNITGTGRVSFGSGAVNAVYPEWWGAVGDAGTTDNTTAINAALACGGVVKLTSTSYYKITDTLTMAVAGTKLISDVKSEIRQATSNKGGVNVTASNCTVHGVKLTGPQYAAAKTSETAIYAYGADSSHYITGLEVTDCDINTWGFYAVLMEFVSDFNVNDNYIHAVYQAGVEGLSVAEGKICRNTIETISGTQPYGISLSRTTSSSLATNPLPRDVLVDSNKIKDVTAWAAIDTHGGQRIIASNNHIRGCLHGIMMGSADYPSGTYLYSPHSCVVSGNDLTGLGTGGYGIAFDGAYSASPADPATGIIIGNFVNLYGDSTIALGCAVYCHDTEGMVIGGNVIANSGANAILMYYKNYGFNISGNTIKDSWSDTVAVGESVGINCNDTYNTGYIGDNTFLAGSASATYLNTTCIKIKSATGDSIRLGKNYRGGWATYLSDTGDKTASGSITGGTTSGSTEETPLCATAILANTIGTRGGIRIQAAGTKTGSAGNKTIKLYFGSREFTVCAAANNTNDWRVEATIVNTATDAQIISWVGYDGATILQGYETTTEDTTAATSVAISGTCANAGDSVSQYLWTVEHF